MADTKGVGAPDPDELLSQSFMDMDFLRHIGQLNEHNVMDYFSRAEIFYDRNCDNEVLKMQQRMFSPEELKKQLLNMKGVQYSLYKANPPFLFVIQKVKRDSPESVTNLSYYYVMDNGLVLMAPDLYTVVSSRFRKCVYHTSAVLQKICSEAKFDVLRGFSWKTVADGDNDEELATRKEEAQDSKLSSDTTRRIDSVLMALTQKERAREMEEHRKEQERLAEEERQKEKELEKERLMAARAKSTDNKATVMKRKGVGQEGGGLLKKRK